MAAEYLLAVAGLCIAGAIALAAHRHTQRARYKPRHTAEQPAVEQHQGATEQWSPMTDIGKPAPIDLGTQLTNCLAQIEHWQRAADQFRKQIAAEDERRVHNTLNAMERQFRDRLSRTGRAVHLEADTAEWRRSDIRRPVRSGAPR